MPRDTRTYITVHDGMPENPKVEVLSDAAFRAIVELWCWCSRNRTDGRIPAAVWVKRVPAKARKELLRDLIVTDGDDFAVHDYLEHQRSAQEIDELSQKRAAAGKKGGKAKATNLASAVASATDVATGLPSNDLAETETDSSSKEELGRPEVEALLEALADAVEANGAKRPTRSKASYEAARLLLDKDGYTPAQVQWMIRWATTHEFWRSVILSMTKLRDKFDQMKLQATDSKHKPPVAFDGGIDVDAILGPDHWAPGAVPEGLTLSEELDWKREQREAHAADRLDQARRKINAA